MIKNNITKVFIIVNIIFILSISNYVIAMPVGLDAFTDGFRIVANSDGVKTCTITGYTIVTYTNIIPEKLNGYTVTRIGERAFKDLKNIAGHVTLPDSIIEIGNEAFSGCNNLISITLGNKTISIGNRAFYNCYNLRSVDLKNARMLGDEVFYKCMGFKQKEILMPKTIKSIGSKCFANSKIEEIKFTAGVAPIVKEDTFSNYYGKVIIPSNTDSYTGKAWSGAIIDGISKMGDINLDGKVDALDASIILDLYKNDCATKTDLEIADLNRDRKLDATDAALVLDMYKNGK